LASAFAGLSYVFKYQKKNLSHIVLAINFCAVFIEGGAHSRYFTRKLGAGADGLHETDAHVHAILDAEWTHGAAQFVAVCRFVFGVFQVHHGGDDLQKCMHICICTYMHTYTYTNTCIHAYAHREHTSHHLWCLLGPSLL